MARSSRPDGTPDPSRRYLVCVAERDLSALMPMLPELAGLPAEQSREAKITGVVNPVH